VNERPTLQITLHPLTVTGSQFRAGEQVTVMATVPPNMLSRRTLASTDGSFVVQFANVAGTPPGLRVRATGSQGSAAIYARRAVRISPTTS
jgi:hypothetical protein